MTTREDIRQFINALDRQIANNREWGDKHSTPEDRYGGLMFYDEAETLEQLKKYLQCQLPTPHDEGCGCIFCN